MPIATDSKWSADDLNGKIVKHRYAEVYYITLSYKRKSLRYYTHI